MCNSARDLLSTVDVIVTSAMRAYVSRILFSSQRIRGETPYYQNAFASLRHLRRFINVRTSMYCENNEQNNVPRYALFVINVRSRQMATFFHELINYDDERWLG